MTDFYPGPAVVTGAGGGIGRATRTAMRIVTGPELERVARIVIDHPAAKTLGVTG
ncbi:hypothetical protein ABZ942_09480 [Nocardia sp. NPDC046473]|uniref:hypothetical protein n=1 Tax=Nocardia sp. NPDC046473 TaxID=3155733 RepID=UPI003402D1AF